jgi:hypothetical protein
MRKLMLLAAGLVALATAGIAVAHGIVGAKSAKAVAGTFAATTASKTETRSCTTTDAKTIEVTHGRWTGTAAGDADLTGPLVVEAKSTINTTDGVGVVVGRFRIDVASGRDTSAGFSAVYDHGKLAGLAVGKAHEPSARLIANISAAFTTATGFSDGKIGASSGGSAVELGPARCTSSKAPSEHSEARGTVSAVSSSSITVAGLTCAVPSSLATKVADVKVNDRAEIRCSLISGTNTLVRFEKKR